MFPARRLLRFLGNRRLPACALCLVGVLSLGRVSSEAPAEKSAAPAGAESTRKALVGTPSCSALSCHGSIEARPGATSDHNEVTLWSLRDPHARAFQVLEDKQILRSKRSKEMAARLGLGDPRAEATCLACHANPRTARKDAGMATKEERIWGVSCEACHGDAGAWLVEHTRPDWREATLEQKRAAGMIAPQDLTGLLKACAGCHVGTPAADGAPPRDVTHDLIAAGHPRMQFEASAFLANLPPHWNADRAGRKGRSEGKVWAIGQVTAAQAALELSKARRSEAWPELAEFSCYACHHDLQPQSWRQQRDVLATKKGVAVRPGLTPWSDWYWLGPSVLAEKDLLDEPAFKANLEKVRPALTPAKARTDGGPLEASLRRMLAAAERWNTGRSSAALKAWSAALGESPDWEQAEQFYLGGVALNEDARLKAWHDLLQSLAPRRAFVESPAAYRPDDVAPLLDALRKAGP
ncbi:MAG: multiheme c-type cytochrome [Gemmataceae bacterium]